MTNRRTTEWSGGLVDWWIGGDGRCVRDCIARSRGCRERLDLLIGYWLLAIGYWLLAIRALS
jgi:hypothetical protein